MRGRLAHMWLTGLLAMSLHAVFCRAATTVAVPSRPLDAATQAQQLLPATHALLQSVEMATLARGRVLTPQEMRIARRLGVAQPERIRVLVTPVLPNWVAPDVMANGMLATAAMTNVSTASKANTDNNMGKPVVDHAPSEHRYGVAGLTAGHGILLGIRHAHNPRVLAHELAHVAQYERLGMREFTLRYLTELLSVGYFRAPLELEADAAMRRVLPILRQSDTAMTKHTRH